MQQFSIGDVSEVAPARRGVSAFASDLSFSAEDVGRAALVATEIATNLVKHGGGGELIVKQINDGTRRGIELLGLRVIEETDRFTLLGGEDARRGKLTLFDADGPRERGALERVGLRVSSLAGRERAVDLGEGLEIELVETATDSELDLDYVAVRASDVETAAGGWETLGFSRLGDARPGSPATRSR